MKLITKKSECKRQIANLLVKSPKEAIRRTLSNYLIKDGYIIKANLPSYVSRDEMVLRDAVNSSEFAVKLTDVHTMIRSRN